MTRLRALVLSAVLPGLFSGAAMAGENRLEEPILYCLDQVLGPFITDEGKGTSQGYRSGLDLIELSTWWNKEQEVSFCRLVGLRRIKNEILIDAQAGMALVSDWIENGGGYVQPAVSKDKDTVLGCGMVDIIARPFEGRVNYNPYRWVEGEPRPVEVIVARPGSFCTEKS